MEKASLLSEWKRLVNMTSKELESFLQTPEGKSAGLSRDEARRQGIGSGQESAKWIIRMKRLDPSRWTDEMWSWATRQVAFIKRMLGVKGPLFKEGKPTRKLLSLLVWGHAPKEVLRKLRANGRDPEAPSRVPSSGLVDARDERKQWLAAYEGGESSRTKRAEVDVLPLGSWRVDDFRGIHGHEVEELVELDPLSLEPGEFDWSDLYRTMLPGRYADAERYAEWLLEGNVPPPIHVVETDRGPLRITDGHRRAAAAHLAGQPVRAWVSWLAPHPEGLVDSNGRPMEVGLTYEIATGKEYGRHA